ncbi:hypothetical protein CTI12_AA044430 [Artemisia annua]|uniref:Uncharacterized protein n=1 Tax=Artemisia annua TaxID=35608 RepID=A0A2U1QD84_ARTAN|nr:hypothetical protein CTI12_AA044430 [Artemisia annua]
MWVGICELPFHPISSEVVGGVGETSSSSLSKYVFPMPIPQLIADLKNRLLMEERNYDKAVQAEEHKVLASTNLHLNYGRYFIKTSKILYFSMAAATPGKPYLWAKIVSTLRAAEKIV